jgi:spermidine/putrescine transport system ATP-binding protein
VLLLDEPLSALDAKLRQQMQIELKSIQEKTGKTFLFVTHDQEEALTMSDQIVVMNNGRIEQMGDPHTLYSRPGSVFVANFIGEANLLRATVVGVDDRKVTLTWNGKAVEAAATGHSTKAGDRVCIVLRPEAIQFSAAPGTGDNSMPGKIRHRVFKGNHTSMLVEVADGGRLNALVHPMETDDLTGDDVWISWKPQNATIIRDEAAAA